MNNQMLDMLKGIKDPKQAVIGILKTNTNPMLKNLVEMAEKGDNEGIEKFARNMFKEQGRDFDSEIKQFMNNFK